MTNEELNTALYQKMFAEQDTYRKWLLEQPPEEILKNAYEYTVREDVVLSLEYNDLTDAQAEALLKSPTPLKDIFHEFEEQETDYIDTVFASMVGRADAVIQAEAEQRRVLLETPVYPHPADYATEHGESETYQASHKANIACRDAIEAAIREHYHDNRLGKEAAQEVMDAFGIDRTLYVLANTVRHYEQDGRISRDNKAWADTVPVCTDKDQWNRDQTVDFIVGDCNPGLTDLFLNQVRREQYLRTPLTAEEIQTEAARLLAELQTLPEPNSPQGTHFIAQVSPDFLARGNSKDTEQLMSMLPFRSMALSGLDGRRGHFLVVPKSEDRNQPLKKPRRSVRKNLQKTAENPSPGTAKKKKQDREVR